MLSLGNGVGTCRAAPSPGSEETDVWGDVLRDRAPARVGLPAGVCWTNTRLPTSRPPLSPVPSVLEL